MIDEHLTATLDSPQGMSLVEELAEERDVTLHGHVGRTVGQLALQGL